MGNIRAGTLIKFTKRLIANVSPCILQYTWPHRYTLTLATQYTNNNIIKQNSTRLIFTLVPQRNVANAYFYTPHFTNATSLEAIHVTTKSPKVTETSRLTF